MLFSFNLENINLKKIWNGHGQTYSFGMKMTTTNSNNCRFKMRDQHDKIKLQFQFNHVVLVNSTIAMIQFYWFNSMIQRCNDASTIGACALVDNSQHIIKSSYLLPPLWWMPFGISHQCRWWWLTCWNFLHLAKCQNYCQDNFYHASSDNTSTLISTISLYNLTVIKQSNGLKYVRTFWIELALFMS
jgi:hypothetical protein